MTKSQLGRDALSDVSVVELGHVAAAPYASLMLSDLGADVVKVEHPDHGDHMRIAGKTGRAIFSAMNRDKQSVALDLDTESDREAFLGLVEEADVIVENFSPNAMEKLDLGYETLTSRNERLIYVRIKGFDEDGPYGNRRATDPIIQAMTGLMAVTGHADSPPARAGTSVVDIATAQTAALAVVLALQRREETGRGDLVTVPLFRSGVAMMGYWLAYRQQFGTETQRMGASHALYVPYDVYPAREKYLFIGATADRHWTAIKQELGLVLDFDERAERLDNRHTIDEAIASRTESRTRDELVDSLLDNDVPAAPVNNLGEVIEDAHLASVDALTKIDTEEAADVAVPTTIPWLSAPERAGNPPSLGTHNASILDDGE